MPDVSPKATVKATRDACLVGLAIFAVASIGLLVSYRVSHHLMLAGIKNRLRDLVVITAAEIDPALHIKISASSQMGNSDYREASEPLLRLRQAVPDVYYAYTLRLQSQDLYFVLDSSYYITNQGDQSAVATTGQLYDDAPPAARLAARAGRVAISHAPYSDQWGTFLSSYAPIEGSDGSTIGIVGVDLSLADLNRQLRPLRQTLGLSLLGSALLAGLVGILVCRSEQSRSRAIADIVRARNLANRAAKESEAANHAKRRFLATMGHEILTPLNGVIGLTSVLLSTSLSSEQATCLQTVKNSGESLLLLLNQLLDFAAVESESVVVESSPVSIRPLLEDILTLFAESAVLKGLQTSVEVDASVPEVVLSDPVHLRQVLSHLVGNAIKFTTSGAVELAVSCRPVQPDGTLPLVFRVHDSGTGLSDTEMQSIFQPFSQGDSSSTQIHGGLGLGLAICRGLVTALGGSIEVKSVAGEGSTFLVTIPVVPTLEPATNAVATIATPPPTVEGFATSHPLRILVVDDNPVNIRVCELMLGRLGYVVSIAWDGEDAVDQQQSLEPDLILMDLRMPKLDGLEATRRIRGSCGNGNRPWIVAITANVREGDRAEALNSGMNDFISKPIQLDRLRSVLKRAHGAIERG
jgi:signal transduction histidine kinase/ActR/RegA family two-component response regulator